MARVSFCLVTTFYPPANFGGDGVHVYQLAHGLAKRGHRVRVVHNPAAYDLLGGAGKEIDAGSTEGIEVVADVGGKVGAAVTYLTGRPLVGRNRLTELMSGFDVVHFHNPSLLGGPGALGMGSGIRLFTTHEHWLLCPTHVLYRYGREVCTRKTCFTCTLSYHRPPQLWRGGDLLDRSIDHVDALLCPSRFTAALHRERFPSARIEVVPLAAPEREEPDTGAPTAAEEDSTFFLYAGRLETIKGVDRLIDAFRGVRGARLLIAGEGTQRAELERQSVGVPSIEFLGRLPRGEVLALCRRARAVVVPSVGYETFGGVALEAMTMGTPCVVRDLGPLPELIEDGGGVVFADDEELARVLQRLVADKAEAARMGAEGRAVAASRFSTPRFFDRYFGIVEDLAAAKGNHELAARAQSARVADVA